MKLKRLRGAERRKVLPYIAVLKDKLRELGFQPGAKVPYDSFWPGVGLGKRVVVNMESMTDFLKKLWPAKRVEALADDDNPLLKMTPRGPPVFVNHRDYAALEKALK